MVLFDDIYYRIPGILLLLWYCTVLYCTLINYVNSNKTHVCFVVVVFFTLSTDRSSTIPSNIRVYQSGTWSQRGTKVNGSHHGDNQLLRPTGVQIATKSYATLQAMAPTNIKTVHQTSLLHISRAASIDSDCCRLPTISVLSNKPDKLRSNQF